LAPTVWWLLLARILCGLLCGAQATALAYVADITPPELRTQRFGTLNAAFWAGIIVGPALGGLLAGADIRAPFWAAAAAAIANGVYGLFVLPESLAPENRTPLRWAAANPWGAARLILSRPGLPILALALVFCWLGFQSKDNMIVFYTAVRYGWSPLQFGLFATGLALAMIAVLSRLAGALSRRIGDPRTALIGLTFQTLGFVAIGLAPSGPWFWAANIPTVLGAVGGPALQAMLSARVGPEEQGRLQGAIGSLSSLTAIAAPLTAAQVFAWSIAGGRAPAWSGLVILIGAGLSLTALALVAASLRRPAPLRPGASAAI
jgi:DHA1 family tetracycline resistance protein-like MFS transporter